MGKAHIRFEKGHAYSRREIHEVVGGSLQSYLPTKENVVVCACLRRDINPLAPGVIRCGVKGRVRRVGEILAEQTWSIPVFIKRKANEWEYFGAYSVNRVSTDPEDLKKHVKRGEGPLSRIIFMKPCFASAKKVVL